MSDLRIVHEARNDPRLRNRGRLVGSQPTPATRAEERILSGASRVSSRASARDEDYPSGDWSECRVRAEFLQQLARDGQPLDVEGAEITGSLDLSNATLTAGIRLRRCLFREPVNLSRATVPAVNLGGSHVARLRAGNLSSDTLLFGNRGVAGSVDVSAASLGRLSLVGLLILGEDANGFALDSNVLSTARSADLGRGFEARGPVRFIGASIGGQLNFRNAVLHRGLFLHEVTTTRALYLRQALLKGRVTLSEAWIRGKLDARDATFLNDGTEVFDLDGATVERAVDLSGAVADGTISIRNSTIKGSLRLSQAALQAPCSTEGSVDASVAAAIRESDLSLRILDGIAEHGRGRLKEIEAQQWDGPSAREPAADIRDPGDVVAVRIDNTEIGAGLICQSSAVRGGITITGTTVSGSVDVRRSHLLNAGSVALSVTDSTIGASLRLRDLASIRGKVVTSQLSLGRLDDDPDAWYEAEGYDIRGLTYQTLNLDGALWSLPERVVWLSRQSPYSAQPYEHLAGLLMRNGRRQEGWRVLQAEQDVRRAARDLNLPKKVANWVSGTVLGHGYRPERAFLVLLLLALLGWPAYEAAWRTGAVRPAAPGVAVVGRCTTSGDCFTPWLYSVDKSLPFLALDGEKAWKLDDRVGHYGAVADVQIALGWVFATAGVAGLTRRVVKN